MAIIQPIAVALIFYLYVLEPLASAESTEFHSCYKGSDVTVTELEINPYPALAGKPATFAIQASTDKPISGGKLLVEVYFIGINIYTGTYDICGETSCPISPGKFNISHSEVLPGITPPGLYNLKIKMKNKENKQLACISFRLSIEWAAVADA